VDFAQMQWVLQPGVGQEGDANYVAEVAIRYGNFINLVIAFIVVAFVVFLIGRQLIKAEPAPPPEPSDEVKLLTEIRDLLGRR
jgi:large conductance mechanosensitive channel